MGLTSNEKVTSQAASVLSNSEVSAGLKEALANGVESAINTLGKSGGFMGNSLVQIPVPDSLSFVEKTARSLGQEKHVDEFVNTMNHSAEQAVPEAATLLANAIRAMSVEDAMKILNGPDDAATQYFRKTSEAKLAERFRPIVEQATNKVGVTSAYKNLTAQALPTLASFGASSESLDVDSYVTNKALDGLFTYIALEEKNIRETPAARATDLLKKVFSQ
ncbi:MAG: hypothetical protein A6F71_10285 [Cycloclasticus sp. symbiont of Poecilosclerida sp. M]|nr:MAG: hypothetical protein A6F71_10285 [Cycloclasticus sp. symbiont of Poecilosclerida sp. M]